MSNQQLDDITGHLIFNKMVQFGEFTLKSGQTSSIYVDLRQMSGYPNLLDNIAELIQQKICTETENFLHGDSINYHQIDMPTQTSSQSKSLTFERIMGVAYNGIPLATALSIKTGIPMIYNRKEVKDHGIRRQLEGPYNKGDRVLVIDDVLTSGTSLKEARDILINHGLKPVGYLTLIDRRPVQYQTTTFDRQPLLTLIKLQSIIRLMGRWNKLPPTFRSPFTSNWCDRTSMFPNSLARRIWATMWAKKSNLILSADLQDRDQILEVIDQTGPHVVAVKLHLDAISTHIDRQFTESLLKLAERHNIFLIEDRKMADIGNTVYNQLTSSNTYLPINRFINAVTVHSLFGYGTLEGVIKAIDENPAHPSPPTQSHPHSQLSGMFLLSESSSHQNLITPEYIHKTLDLAKNPQYQPYITGFVSQKYPCSPKYLNITPGVKINTNPPKLTKTGYVPTTQSDQLGQRYRTPEQAIQSGTDLIIVGRGIVQSPNPAETAQQYRQASWSAYLQYSGWVDDTQCPPTNSASSKWAIFY